MDDLERQIRGQIIRYLSGSIDARALYDSLFEDAWEIERGSPGRVAEMARRAQLTLDEFAAEGWGEDELKSRLRGVVGVIGLPTAVEATSGSASATYRQPGGIGWVSLSEWTPAGR